MEKEDFFLFCFRLEHIVKVQQRKLITFQMMMILI